VHELTTLLLRMQSSLEVASTVKPPAIHYIPPPNVEFELKDCLLKAKSGSERCNGEYSRFTKKHPSQADWYNFPEDFTMNLISGSAWSSVTAGVAAIRTTS